MKSILKSKISWILALFVVGNSCCSDPEPTPIPVENAVVPFKILPSYKNAPFQIGKSYDLDDTTRVRFSRLSFILTHVTLTRERGIKTHTEAINFDFSSLTDSAKSAQGITQKLNGELGANYQSTGFTVGVSTDLNSRRPASFPLASPLSNDDDYWASWNSYIFVKLEGALDRDKNGVFESPFTLHTGGTNVARDFTNNRAFTPTETVGLRMRLRMEDVLTSINLRSVSSAHSIDQIALMQVLTGNIANGLTID